MNFKWKISTLFLLLLLVFGAFQEQTSTPNQEIVLEFIDDVDITNQETTVKNLTDKLLELGAANINISETKKGVLKITYFSTTTIESIKHELLSDSHVLAKHNSEKNQKEGEFLDKYSLAISEIQNVFDSNSTNDNYIVDLKLNYDRSTSTYHIVAIRNPENFKASLLFLTKLSANKRISYHLKNTTNGEPEVRAGPSFITLT